jgi:16S rRNA (cytosine1402-N4)-methyltransferase
MELQSLLDIRPESVVVDATLGHAGHALEIAGKLGCNGRLIGLDVDADALDVARDCLEQATCPVALVRENFGRLDEVLKQAGVEKVDLILADLGVNSAQLADSTRGISFQTDGPLDMRLDDRLETTAADLVNAMEQEALADLIFRYGEERMSRRIARRIVERRRSKRIQTTGELIEIIFGAMKISTQGRRSKIHPATRTFQALRIAVNEELDQLERLLELAPGFLNRDGYLAVISFHSLEDRLVKYNFRENKTAGHYRILTKKPIVADCEETRSNPRSRSAKLRVAQRL